MGPLYLPLTARQVAHHMGAGRGAEMGNGSGAGTHLSLTCVVFMGGKRLAESYSKTKGVPRQSRRSMIQLKNSISRRD